MINTCGPIFRTILVTCALVLLLAACGSAPAASSLTPNARPALPTAPPETTPSPTPPADTVAADPAAVDTQAGRSLYAEVCAPCHGFRARGIDGIAVDLVESPFVAGLTPEQLTNFLIRGLSINNPFNVTDIKMPPRGGRDELSDQDMMNIAAYLQSINNAEESAEGKQRIAEYLAWLEEDGAQEIEATPEVGKEGLSGPALEGQTIYLRFCAVCHGPNGEGVESLGKGFRNDPFILEQSDQELAEFISMGRPADHPRNDTGIEMLPYGGQPFLDDDQLSQVVAYIRAINTGDYVPPQEIAGVERVSNDTSEPPLEEEAFALIESTSPKCFTCHLIGSEGNPNGPGPNLNGLQEYAADRVEGMSAEEYVRQAILDPGAHIVDECPRGPCVDVMTKNYGEKLSDDEVDVLVRYLLSLEALPAEQ